MMITRRLNIKFSTILGSVVRVVGLRAMAVTAVRRLRKVMRMAFRENMVRCWRCWILLLTELLVISCSYH